MVVITVPTRVASALGHNPQEDDNLLPTEKKIEALACQQSVHYFVQRYVWISDPNKGRVKFEMWPVHNELLDIVTTNQRIITLKARQVGVSWLAAAYALWRASFFDGANVLMLSKREDEARALLAKSFYIYQNLPIFLRRKVHKHNETEFSFTDPKIPGVASTAIKAFPSTEDAGRSESASDVICDEWAFHPFAQINYAAYKPTIDAGGRLWGISTANGSGNFFHVTYLNAKIPDEKWTRQHPIGLNGFVPLFIPWYARPSRDEAWYSQQIKEYSDTPSLLPQEYPASDLEAFRASGNVYFNKERISLWMRYTRQPVDTDHLGVVKRWEFPIYGEKYILGADCAEGRGEDLSGAAIYHYRTMRHVADIHGDLTPDLFASLLVELAREYNNAFCCIERNNAGTGVLIDVVQRYQYTNVLRYRPIQNSLKLGRSQIKEYQANSEYGWPTNQLNRPMMLKDLSTAISSGSITSYDKLFWEECMTFVNLRGKLQASDGNKDDRVFKHALAIQAAKHFEAQDETEMKKDTIELILRGSV
jgi:hypothetical protein